MTIDVDRLERATKAAIAALAAAEARAQSAEADCAALRAAARKAVDALQADVEWHAEQHCPGNGGYAAEGVCICADMENVQAAIAALAPWVAK